MLYKCIHKKFGIILYRKGIDILISLSWALGSLEATDYNKSEPTAKQSLSTTELSKQQVLTYAGHIINDIIHEENKKHSPESWLLDPSSFSITDYIQNVDPFLIQFLEVATSTVREREHNYKTEHAKNVRIFFITCLLQYCTNLKPTLMHHLLSDVVEVCGGSRQLMRILNRLGCVSSPDTHDRFITERAEKKRQQSIWEEIPAKIFTVASVDNFDMLQSHSAIYTGNQQQSFHGSTVQLVQPDPNRAFCNNSEIISTHENTLISSTPVVSTETDTYNSTHIMQTLQTNLPTDNTQTPEQFTITTKAARLTLWPRTPL